MNNKIFKLTTDNTGEYEIRFLPNINDIYSTIVSFRAFYYKEGINKYYVWKFISYALINYEIKIIIYSNKIHLKQFIPNHNLINLSHGSYLDIKTKINEESQLLKYKEIGVKYDDKYIFDKPEEQKQKILSLYDEIKHIRLVDVAYNEMIKCANFDCHIPDKKMKDIYKQDYSEFEQKYKVHLRNKKILNIKNRINKQLENEYIINTKQ